MTNNYIPKLIGHRRLKGVICYLCKLDDKETSQSTVSCLGRAHQQQEKDKDSQEEGARSEVWKWVAMSSIEQSVRLELPAEEVAWPSLDRSTKFIPRAMAHFVITVPKEFKISQEWQIRCLSRSGTNIGLIT